MPRLIFKTCENQNIFIFYWGEMTEMTAYTRRAEHPAEARQKLRESSAHLQLCSKLQGAVVVIPSKKITFTLEKLENYDAQDPRNA